MNTFKGNITVALDGLDAMLNEFLRNHTSLTPINKPGDRLRLISASGDNWFSKLDDEGIRFQDKLTKSIQKIVNIIDVLLVGCASNQRSRFHKNVEKLLKVIEQTTAVTQNEIHNASETILDIKNQLDTLFPGVFSEIVLVIDTNALYDSPDIEKWKFKEVKSFLIILTPSVVADLDDHKINHRNEVIRNQAKSIINRIKEYRRRGSLIDGVTIVKNKIQLRTIATEPDFSNTLKWLDRNNKDDRLIAEFFDIARLYANSPVILITSDINLQNKCEFCMIPFLEPPQIDVV